MKLLVYDRTCRGRFAPGLSAAWATGARFYSALGRLDAHFAATSWPKALDWLASHGGDAPIDEIQFWGHGKWGDARIADGPLDVRALKPSSPLYASLCAIRGRIARGKNGLFWFRTCESFGADRGHDFAQAWSDFFGCRVAGHTYVIGYWQSGLHSILPGEIPSWSADEGLAEGTAAQPVRALLSTPFAPNTITCFDGRIPDR